MRNHDLGIIAAGALLAAVPFVLGWCSFGLAEKGPMQAAAYGACGLLALLALAAFAWGRWRPQPAEAWLLATAGVLLVWTAFQQLPISSPPPPAWEESFPGVKPPGALAHAPEAAWAAWQQAAAAACYMAGVFWLCHRRRGRRALILIAIAVVLAEGIAGFAGMALHSSFRATASLFNPNHFAAFVLAGLPLAGAGLWLLPRRSRRFSAPLLSGKNPLIVLLLPLLGAALGWAGAGSRGSFLAAGLALPCVLLAAGWGNRRAMPYLLGGVAAGLLALVIAAELLAPAFRDRLDDRAGVDAGRRVELWQTAWRAWTSEPRVFILGVGLGGTENALNRHLLAPREKAPIHAHNDWIQVPLELGLAGLLLAGIPLVMALRCWQANWSPGTISWASLAGLATLAIHSLGDFPLRIPVVLFLALILVGIVLHDHGPGRKRKRRPAEDAVVP